MSPEDNCLRTITRFPLWTPARTIATVPGVSVGLNDLACFEKKFVEVPLGALKSNNKLLKSDSTKSLGFRFRAVSEYCKLHLGISRHFLSKVHHKRKEFKSKSVLDSLTHPLWEHRFSNASHGPYACLRS